jgi:uncharacterized membrane protein YdfJ with MMPL/SSD domain
MASAGRAVVFSGTTVAIGLLSLVVLPVPFLRSVGFGSMMIPLVSVAVATTLLPVVLSKFGRRLDWPHLRSDDRASRFWTRWAKLVVRRRWIAAGSGAAILVGLVVAATSIHLDSGSGDPNTLSQRGDAKQGLDALERSGIGDGVLTPIEILQQQADHFAKQLVRPRRQTQRPLAPILLGDIAPPDGPKPIALVTQSVDDARDLGHGHAIRGFRVRTWGHRSLVGVDAPVGQQIQLRVEQLSIQLI